jgi:hypothetical protein
VGSSAERRRPLPRTGPCSVVSDRVAGSHPEWARSVINPPAITVVVQQYTVLVSGGREARFSMVKRTRAPRNESFSSRSSWTRLASCVAAPVRSYVKNPVCSLCAGVGRAPLLPATAEETFPTNRLKRLRTAVGNDGTVTSTCSVVCLGSAEDATVIILLSMYNPGRRNHGVLPCRPTVDKLAVDEKELAEVLGTISLELEPGRRR